MIERRRILAVTPLLRSSSSSSSSSSQNDNDNDNNTTYHQRAYYFVRN